MDTKAEIRLGGPILLATTVLSLILVLTVGLRPITILSAIITMAAAAGDLIWTSCRQQHQLIERLKKSDIDPEKDRVNEANLYRIYHSSGQAQKDAATLVCLPQKCLVDETHAMLKKRPTRQEVNQVAMQRSKGRKRLYR